MNHCSSEGATVGIQSYLSSRLKLQFKTKFQNPKQFQFNFKSKYISISFQYQYPKLYFKIHFQFYIKLKMQQTIHLSDLWEHTITKIFKHDPESELDIMLRQWVIYNKLEDFNSLLKYTDEDLIPHGVVNLSFYKENGDSVVKMMSPTPLQELIKLRWYIQHLIHESGYLYDDDESNYPLSEDKWMLQTHGKFMKFVFYILHRMTPEQMKMNPIKPIIKVKTNEELVTEEGESTKVQEEFTTSEELTEEYSTCSDMSKQDSESDINVDYTQDEENPQTPELKIHITYDTIMHDEDGLIHDEYNTSEDENIIEIETYEDSGEKIHETEESIPTETSQVLTVFNKAIHHEDDSSDDKSVIEIEPPQENGKQEIGKQDKLLTTKFQIEIENQKLEGLITYSTDQQIFKFKVNSWGVNIEFTLYELKCTIHAILQHMGFYHTTENPCVMMRAKHNTKSCECIILHQDELYIASSTLQEILHIVKEKYNIKINSNDYQGSNFPYDPGGAMIC